VAGARQARVTLWAAAFVPLPLKTAWGEFSALLTNLILPETCPAVCGANVTLKVALWPAGTVKGNTMPAIENPGPPQSAELTVILVSPAVRVAVRPFLVPTVTLPKSSVAGDTARLPAATGWLGVPEPLALPELLLPEFPPAGLEFPSAPLEFPPPQPSRIAVVKMIKPENKRPCMRAALLGKRDGSRTTSNSVTTTPGPYVRRVIDTSINRLAFPA